MEPEQQVDWVEGAPGDELKRKVNQSIRMHNQRELRLHEIHELGSGSNRIRLLLLYEKR
jgi:hypothetical protein